MGSEVAVEIFNSQINEHLPLLKEENSREALMKAEGYRLAMAFIEEKSSDKWAARLLELSRQNTEIFVDLITRYAESNYLRYQTGKG